MRRRMDVALRHARNVPGMLQRAFLAALRHDALNLSQSAAYSAIVSLFPALIVLAAIIALLPQVAPLQVGVAEFFDEVLPPNALSLLTSYFVSGPGGQPSHTVRSLVIAGIVSVSGASSVIVTLMEGVRRAEGLPRNCWKGIERRKRALILVPLSLLPLLVATLLVMFGRILTEWAAAYLATSVQSVFFAFALAARWIISLGGVAGLTASIYHFGMPERRSRVESVPGALVATLLWFMSTLAFGWYVTRFANYNQVYGPLGAGIALLIWLYLVFFSVLCGAEFNAQVFGRGHVDAD